MNCNTTHYRANSSSVPGDPTDALHRVDADLRPDATGVPASAAPLFGGDRLAGPVLFIGTRFLEFPRVVWLTIKLELDKALPASLDARQVRWEWWDGERGHPIDPQPELAVRPGATFTDSTAQLTRNGEFSVSGLSAIPETVVAGIRSRWLCCRLMTPLETGDGPRAGRVREAHLPTLKAPLLSVHGVSDYSMPDAMFADGVPLDPSRAFQPFGPQPRAGSAWYIAHRQVLSRDRDVIELSFNILRPSGTALTLASGGIELNFETWTGQGWESFGTSNGKPAVGHVALNDYGNAFTNLTTGYSSWPTRVIFRASKKPRPTRVNGVENFWLRVRLASGGYAADTAPLISDLRVMYRDGDAMEYAQSYVPRFAPDALVVYDGLEYRVLPPNAPLRPFVPPASDTGRSLYLGYAPPAGATSLRPRPLATYFALYAPAFGTTPDDAPSGTGQPQLAWEYWGPAGWTRLGVRDDTQGLCTSGAVEFLPPPDFTARDLFNDKQLLWVRARLRGGGWGLLPRPSRVLLDAVDAQQRTTVPGEILGSGTGEASQEFIAAQSPLLAGQKLEVRESELPSAAERTAIEAEEGADAVRATAHDGVWVRWHPVGDFHASGPRDRHYVVDHARGAFVFGNGQQGLVPPRGSGSIRLARYAIGGGAAGNVAAGQVTQLKTTLPFVAGVTNLEAASGGVHAESNAQLVVRAPRSLRHGDRAVTREDLEDLAMTASTEVARARCVPLLDLERDPAGATPRPGTVSLIVVPNSSLAAPVPNLELISRVRRHLDARRLPGTDLVVVGPEYVQVEVQCQLGITLPEAARDAEQGALSALAAFLHPLTGGREGSGWDFGRRPYRSDLYALLEAVPGVDHVRSLVVNTRMDRPGADTSNRFLVCSGVHRVELSMTA